MDISLSLISLLLQSSLRTLILAGVISTGLTCLARRRDASIHHAAWTAVLLGSLLMPFMAVVLPPLALPVFYAAPEKHSTVAKVLPQEATADSIASQSSRQNSPSPDGLSTENDSDAMRLDWHDMLAGAYLIVGFVLLIRLAVGLVLTKRLALRSTLITDERLLVALTPMSGQAEVRTSSAVTVPVTFGFVRPVILFPAAWKNWECERLRAVLAHEMCHVHRSDFFVHVLASLHCCVFWFSPLSWWLTHRLSELADYAGDDAALRAVGDRHYYAEVLVSFLSSLHHAPGRVRWQGVPMMQFLSADRRLDRILDPTRRFTVALKWRQLLLLLGLTVPVILVAATVSPTARPAAVRFERTAQRSRAIGKSVVQNTPLFSSAYIEAVRVAQSLTPVVVAELERRLRANPTDSASRVQLLAYYAQTPDVPRRRSHVFWLIRHEPEAEVLHSPYAGLGADEITADQYRQATQLWRQAATGHPESAGIAWNAAQFFRRHDQSLYEQYLKRAVSLAPRNGPYGTELGILYAQAIVTSAETATQARQELDTCAMPAVLEAATRVFQSEHNSALLTGRMERDFGSLAARYFSKALMLDPGLDKQWVFPQLSANMVGALTPGSRQTQEQEEFQRRLEKADRDVVRLSPSAFPELPSNLIQELRRRGCTIPQESYSRRRNNVIQGQFARSGQTDWAILCSIDRVSRILVFWNGSEKNPAELAVTPDLQRVQSDVGEKVNYSRGIRATAKDAIASRLRAAGDPAATHVDHQGIDDAFIEKASQIYYFQDGKWLRLPGAD